MNAGMTYGIVGSVLFMGFLVAIIKGNLSAGLMPDPFTMTTGIGKGLNSVSSPLLDELSDNGRWHLLKM